MSLDTQIADAGAIKIAADAIVRLAQRAQALQAAGGAYSDPENPEVTVQLSPAQRQGYQDALTAKWTLIKQKVAAN